LLLIVFRVLLLPLVIITGFNTAVDWLLYHTWHAQQNRKHLLSHAGLCTAVGRWNINNLPVLKTDQCCLSWYITILPFTSFTNNFMSQLMREIITADSNKSWTCLYVTVYTIQSILILGLLLAWKFCYILRRYPACLLFSNWLHLKPSINRRILLLHRMVKMLRDWQI